MLTHQYKNFPDVESVHFHIRLSVYSPAMDEHIIEVAGRESSYRSQQICDASVECVTNLYAAGALLSPCGITSHSQSMPLGVLTAV